MMFKKFLTLASVASAAFLSAVDAKPNGAPRCVINLSGIQKAHIQPPSDIGAKLSASSLTYTPGQVIEITVERAKSFKGILLYAAQGEAFDFAGAGDKGDNRLSHVGQFLLDQSTPGFRASDQAICDTAKVKNDAASSTITHANPSDKGAKVVFKWQAPAGAVGPITLTGVLNTGPPNNPWGPLNQITLQPAAGGNVEQKQPPPAGCTGNIADQITPDQLFAILFSDKFWQQQTGATNTVHQVITVGNSGSTSTTLPGSTVGSTSSTSTGASTTTFPSVDEPAPEWDSTIGGGGAAPTAAATPPPAATEAPTQPPAATEAATQPPAVTDAPTEGGAADPPAGDQQQQNKGEPDRATGGRRLRYQQF